MLSAGATPQRSQRDLPPIHKNVASRLGSRPANPMSPLRLDQLQHHHCRHVEFVEPDGQDMRIGNVE